MAGGPFRFGIQVARGENRDDWQDKARRVEALGFDVLATVDHFTDVFAWAPAIVSAAEATTTLRFCPYVLDNDFRHPAVVAQDAATVDVLTDGRLELGLGAGWLGADYQKTGIPFDAGKIRVARLFESVQIVKGYFTGETVSFAGEHYEIAELPGNPRPVQQPHPPIMLGGGGPKILAFAAREAEIVSVMSRSRPDGSGFDRADGSAAGFDRKIAGIREAAGPRWEALELNILLEQLTVTRTAAETRAALDELAGKWEMTAEEIAGTPVTLIGTVEEIIEKIRAGRARWGSSSITIRESYRDDFAPVVKALAGS